MVSTLKEINVISNTQVTGRQTISIDELAKQLTTTDSVKQFHINLPDDLKRNLSPFVSGPKNEYINKLNSELTKRHYSLATNTSSHTPGAGYVNAYYPNFREEEPKVAPQIPVNEEPQDNREELEYSFELAGGKSAFAKHVGWTFALSATEEEPANKSWQESESELGSILTAKTKVSVPRRLCSESGSSPMPLTAENTNSTTVGSNKADEAFMAIMPTIQFGDKLGCPTQGYYYHFKDGKLIQEYKILGDKKFAFNLTYSDESSLTDDLRLNKPQSAIPILWRDQGSDVQNQHLLYQTSKLTSEKLSEVDTSWLDEHGLALDMGELSKICAGEDSDNDQYHSPTSCTYEHPGLFLHGTEIVALNNPSNMSKGVPVVNLKPEKIFRIGVFFDGTGQNDKNDAYKEERGNKSRTNVARLFAAYPQVTGKSEKIYVSGVGTVDIDDDAQRLSLIHI